MASLPLTALREHLTEAVNGAAYKNERLVIEKHGKAVAALVPIDDLRALERLDKAEDASDRAVYRARRGEPMIPWEDVKKEIKALDARNGRKTKRA